MKSLKYLALAALLAIGISGSASATVTNFQNFFFYGSGCSTASPYPPPVSGAICADVTGAVYVWTGAAFVGSSLVPSGATLASPTLNNATIGGGIAASSSGYQSIIMASPVAMCTTSNTVGAACAEPTWSFSPVGFADTTYSVQCACTGTVAGVPVIQKVVKASNTLVVSIAALTTVSASCGEIDCVAIHQ